MSTERRLTVRNVKWHANRRGHDMGNAVNVSPLLGTKITVRSSCRRCRFRVFITQSLATGDWDMDAETILTDCPDPAPQTGPSRSVEKVRQLSAADLGLSVGDRR